MTFLSGPDLVNCELSQPTVLMFFSDARRSCKSNTLFAMCLCMCRAPRNADVDISHAFTAFWTNQSTKDTSKCQQIHAFCMCSKFHRTKKTPKKHREIREIRSPKSQLLKWIWGDLPRSSHSLGERSFAWAPWMGGKCSE